MHWITRRFRAFIQAQLPRWTRSHDALRRSHRRGSVRGIAWVCLEKLEWRTLLTANVAAAVSGTALTVTCDNTGDHTIDVFRITPTQIEVAASNGTLVNGAASALFKLSSVSGISVNLGNGYDTISIDSHFGDAALNIGTGGIVFHGAGGTGDHLVVCNGSSNPMTIAGSVTVQGTTAGSALNLTGSTNSSFYLFTDSGDSLTVQGNVSVSEQGSGAGAYVDNDLFSAGNGSLHINGSVTETAVEGGTSFAENDVEITALGNVVVDGSVTQAASSVQDAAKNIVLAEFAAGGNLSIGKSLTQTSAGYSGTATVENDVQSVYANNITIGQAVSQTAASPASHIVRNVFDLQGKGNVSVGGSGGLTQLASGSVDCYNDTALLGSGTMTITGPTTQTASGGVPSNSFYDSGAGNISTASITQNAHANLGAVDDQIASSGSGLITIGAGGVAINTYSSESVPVGAINNTISTGSKGRLTTSGMVQITTTNSPLSPEVTTNKIATSGTSAVLSVGGISIKNAGWEGQQNLVTSGGAAIKIGSQGVTINGSGIGTSDDEIVTNAVNSPITIGGAVKITEPGGGQSIFNLEAKHTNSYINVTGNVNFDNHLSVTNGGSFVTVYGDTDIANSALTITGSLTLSLAKTTGMATLGNTYANLVTIGFDDSANPTGYGTIIDGLTNITGGTGPDDVGIIDSLLVLGTTIDLKTNPIIAGQGFDHLEIDGSILGGATTVTMSGPDARIEINNGMGYETTEFLGLFTANLTGSKPQVDVAAGTGPGDSMVFFTVANIVGAAGQGGIFKDHSANVSGTILLTHFGHVTV